MASASGGFLATLPGGYLASSGSFLFPAQLFTLVLLAVGANCSDPFIPSGSHLHCCHTCSALFSIDLRSALSEPLSPKLHMETPSPKAGNQLMHPKLIIVTEAGESAGFS